MTKLNKTLAVATLFSAVLAMSSCQKEKVTPTVKTELNTEVVNTVYAEVFESAFQDKKLLLSFKNNTCAIETEDSSALPTRVRTFDFGSGCMDDNGKIKSGKFILTYNNSDVETPGTTIGVTFNQFVVEGQEIQGSIDIENQGDNGNGNMVITFNGSLHVIDPVNGDFDVDAQQSFERTEGASTSEKVDDVYSITGHLDVLTTNGEHGRVTVLQPLIKKRDPSCKKYFVKGETITEETGKSDTYLDYGDGTCDNLAVQTIDGNSQTITLD